MKNINNEAAEYFNVVGKNEKDMMANTKNFVTRTRLRREVTLNEDFRKRFMTRDYGNYEKYEKNSIQGETESGEKDFGEDVFVKNYNRMLRIT